MGIKEFMPPYLDRSLSLKELMSGVIFASAASGFDPLTAKLSRVIPMPKQLQHFKEYKRRIANEVGREKMEQLIKDSVFLISAGTNDFAVNYFPFPFRKNFTVPVYQLQKATDFILALKNEGVQRMIIVGLPPIGCLPVIISLYSLSITRSCLL